jgi:hypothetical protein
MELPPFTISPVLREAAELKAIELNRAKNVFTQRYDMDARRSADPDSVKRVARLLEDIKKLDPNMEDDDDLAIISRYVEEAQDSQSVSESKVLRFEEQLWTKLNKHVNRLEISLLHVELMREVMNGGDTAGSKASSSTNTVIDDEDDFEVVEHRLDEVLEAFEKETFTSRHVDVEAIEAFLCSLFDTGNKHDLEDLRFNIQEFGDEVADGMELDQDFLTWAIMDLLKTNLVNTQKKQTLESYVQSPIAMRELLSIINMKSVRDWEYKEAEKGLPVTARLNADGKYHITVEEDLIDLMFLHCVGLRWSMNLKSSLLRFVRVCTPFTNPGLSANESNKREFFLAGAPRMPKTAACSACHPPYESVPLPPPRDCFVNVPPPPPPPVVIMGPSYKKKKKGLTRWSGMSHIQDSLNEKRNTKYMNEFCMARLPTSKGCTPEITENVQAGLIKTLAVEAKLRTTFDGYSQVAAMNFNALETSLPHQTVLTVLKFLGVPKYFLDFSSRFLETKLNIGPAVRGAPDRILPRACGLPAGHALSLCFTEAIMFLVELLVRQKTGASLYRLKDECYFVGSLQQQQQFEDEVTKFADTMSLSVSVEEDPCIGFLIMEGDGTRIDNSRVDTYARFVKEQLTSCNTVLDWVRVWNDTVGTYAAHLFGPLAEIFGKSHLEAVKRAYSRIFRIVLPGGNLTSHVQQLLAKHIKQLPNKPALSIEAFIYLPPAYGGLGVKTPFVTLNLARIICDTPDKRIEKYLDAEENYFNRAAENWTQLSPEARSTKYEVIFANNDEAVAAALGSNRDLATFMTKDELTANRERAAYPVLPYPPYPSLNFPIVIPSLTDLYADLLHEPIDDITWSDKVYDGVRRLSGKGDLKSWSQLSGEDKWVLQLYGDECFECYGGLEIWCGEYVPQEVLKMIRGQMWDEDDDDDDDSRSSVSDMTEP